ncbi:unnamed protein product, partial [marine sediment metagenome]
MLEENNRYVTMKIQYEGNPEGIEKITGSNNYKFDLFKAMGYNETTLYPSEKMFIAIIGTFMSEIEINILSTDIIDVSPKNFQFSDDLIQDLEEIIWLADIEFDINSLTNYEFIPNWVNIFGVNKLYTLPINPINESDIINFLDIIGFDGLPYILPGFSRFKSSVSAANRGGVLIAQENFIEYMDIPEPAFIDKIFIKLTDKKLPQIDQIEVEIENKFESNYDFYITNVERSIRNQEQTFMYLNMLFQLITMATVVICLFGLLSASYSTILERKKEIAIVRTLGLKGNSVNRMFIIEAFIIMISSGAVGVLVGWLTAWLLTS